MAKRGGNKDDAMKDDEKMTAQAVSSLFCQDGIVQKFSGDDKTYTSSKWAQDVEENAEIFGWTPAQKLLIARRSLTGVAAMWLKTESVFKTYDELKMNLVKEFPDTINSKEAHEYLVARKKLRNETYYEYMLHMKEYGKRGKIEDSVIIEYVVDGIEDLAMNKAILYGETTYAGLKQKLTIYEKIKNKSNEGVFVGERQIQRNNISKRKCYNCGSIEHVASECKTGVKCFLCNEYGHIAGQCTKSVRMETMTTTSQDGNAKHMGGYVKPIVKQRSSMFSMTTNQPTKEDQAYCDIARQDVEVCHEMTSTGDFGRTDKDVMQILDVPTRKNCTKFVMVNNVKVNALIDTRSDENLTSLPTVKKEVKKCITEYNPVQREEAPIKLKIVSRDSVPEAQRPRRTSLMEQHIVEKQVNEWCNPHVAVTTTLTNDVRTAQDKDDGLRAIKEILKENSYNGCWIENGLLYKGDQKRLVVPKMLEKEVIRRIHSNGHFAKMKKLLKRNYFLRNEDRESLRQQAKEQILKIQEENRKSYNKDRKENHKYVDGHLVSIKRTQFDPGIKFKHG